MISSPRQVLEFWFSAAVQPLWFQSTPAFDSQLTERFLATWRAAASAELAAWEDSAEGALALVICLDQFPLNMFRGQAQSFTTEAAARGVAGRAIARGFDRLLSDPQKAFLYLPYMHSETLADQDRSVALFRAAGLLDNLKFAEHHREIIRCFGRFPHRNAILGRESTPQEREYLASEQAFLG